MDFVINIEYDIDWAEDICWSEWNLHRISEVRPRLQKKGETGMLYYTIGIDEKTWEMLEKICKNKDLTPDQLIKQGIEKVVEKEYVDAV